MGIGSAASKRTPPVVNTAMVAPGSNVVVFRLGGIGLNVIQGAKVVDTDKIVGVDINDSNDAWCRQFGMTPFVNPKKVDGDIAQHLVMLTERGSDCTFDCSGEHQHDA